MTVVMKLFSMRTTTSGSDEGHSIQQEDFTRNNVLAEVVTGATVGSSSAIPVITFNNQGLITSMTTVAYLVL